MPQLAQKHPGVGRPRYRFRPICHARRVDSRNPRPAPVCKPIDRRTAAGAYEPNVGLLCSVFDAVPKVQSPGVENR